MAFSFPQTRQADNRYGSQSVQDSLPEFSTHEQTSKFILPVVKYLIFYLSQCVKILQLGVGLQRDAHKFRLIHFYYALLPFGVLSLDLWDGLELKISLALKCHTTFVQKGNEVC